MESNQFRECSQSSHRAEAAYLWANTELSVPAKTITTIPNNWFMIDDEDWVIFETTDQEETLIPNDSTLDRPPFI
jgi:hypothetical protein